MGPFEPTKDSDASWRSQSGATAAEYAILVSLIAVVIISAVMLLGQRTNALYKCTADSYEARQDACKEADENSDD